MAEKATMGKYMCCICVAASLLLKVVQGMWNQSCRIDKATLVWISYIPIVFVIFPQPLCYFLIRKMTVEANEWAQFNCTVHCGYHVSWYMARHSNAIKAIGRNNLVRLHTSSCTESNERTHFIEVLATKALNISTFYCAAYEQHDQERSCSCGTGGRCYSRPALLTGKHDCI